MRASERLSVMKELRLTKADRMLLTLLRASIGTGGESLPEDLFAGAGAEDWDRCYRLASAQGVRALAWDGILTLSPEQQPPRAQKLLWGADVSAYEDRYKYYCRAVSDLMTFLAEHGIASVQLKGTGMSSCYPVPSHREGGDIDIYTWSADPSNMNDAEANALTDRLMEDRGLLVDREHSVKHSLFYWQGVPVENHKTFLNVTMYSTAADLDRLLYPLLRPRAVALGEDSRVFVPSPEFNTVFVAFHTVQHYGAGLTLHHLCDWACLLRHYGLSLPPEVTDPKVLRGISALTAIARDCFGVEAEPPVDPAGLDRRMLAEALHPSYSVRLPAMSRPAVLLYKTRRMLHRLHINREVVDESALKYILSSIVIHIRKPKSIFG